MRLILTLVIACLVSTTCYGSWYSNLLTHIIHGNHKAVQLLLRTAHFGGGERMAVQLAIKSLGDAMLDQEINRATNQPDITTLILPAAVTALTTVIAHRLKTVSCTIEKKEEVAVKKVEPIKKIETVLLPQEPDHLSQFSEEPPRLSNLSDITITHSTETLNTQSTKTTTKHNKERQELIALVGTYAPWAVGILWLLPIAIKQAKLLVKKYENALMIKAKKKLIGEHAKIVKTLLGRIQRRGATIDEYSIALLRSYQDRVKTKENKCLLLSLEYYIEAKQEPIV